MVEQMNTLIRWYCLLGQYAVGVKIAVVIGKDSIEVVMGSDMQSGIDSERKDSFQF